MNSIHFGSTDLILFFSSVVLLLYIAEGGGRGGMGGDGVSQVGLRKTPRDVDTSGTAKRGTLTFGF